MYFQGEYSKKGFIRGETALSIFFFSILAYFYLGFDIFKGEIVAPMDLLLQYPGWQESGFNLPLINGQRSDILDAILPRWIFVKRTLLSGHLPLWNPLVGGGQPGFPLLHGSYISPSFLLFCLFDDGVGFTLALLVRLIIAGLGAYWLCRIYLGIMPSLFGGITFMMCGFNASWLMWPQVATSAWIPWVLWACIRFIYIPDIKRMIILTVSVSFLLLGGFPYVAFCGLFLASLLSIWLLINIMIKEKSFLEIIKLSLWLNFAVFLALPLISFQLIPFIEYLNEVDLGWRHAGSIPISKIHLLWRPFKEGIPHVEYAGYAGKLSILFIPFALKSGVKGKIRQGPFSPFFWCGMLILTFMLIYGEPDTIVTYFYKLPVFDFNQNGRMLSLLGLELAVIGAVGYQALLECISSLIKRANLRKSKAILFILGLIILTIQILDISRVGRAQNAIVPKETFYPWTPAIRFAKERIKPGQSILHTTRSFKIPGTLTSYGLPDWFAHTHRKKNEISLLENLVNHPWASPTAAVFHFDQIKIKSPYFDALAVKFIFSELATYMIAQSRNDTPLQLMPGKFVTQRLLLKEQVAACGVQVLTATYRKVPAGCAASVSLLDNSGNEIASKILAKEFIRDNRWTTFYFGREVLLEPGIYDIKIEAIGKPSAPPIAIWSLIKRDGYSEGYLIKDGERQNGDLSFRLLGNRYSVPKNWTLSKPGDRIIVFERKSVPPGAYLLKSNADFETFSQQDMFWEDVQILESTNGTMRYKVTTDKPCWLVRTARLWPGWKVLVNGQERDIKPYLGVLPAVKLGQGEAVIEWRYDPESWRWGCIISSVTALFILILFFVPGLFHKKKR